MFCGGSFRSKTIEKNDDYYVVSLNDRTIKIKRSASLNKADQYDNRLLMRKRRILPPKVPEIKHCVHLDGAETVSFHAIYITR